MSRARKIKKRARTWETPLFLRHDGTVITLAHFTEGEYRFQRMWNKHNAPYDPRLTLYGCGCNCVKYKHCKQCKPPVNPKVRRGNGFPRR